MGLRFSIVVLIKSFFIANRDRTAFLIYTHAVVDATSFNRKGRGCTFPAEGNNATSFAET